MPELVLRPMMERDLPDIMEIERASFATPWSQQEMRGELLNEIAHYQVAEWEGQVVAYAGYWLIGDEAHITNVAVRSGCRRRGFGEKVVRSLMEEARGNGVHAMTLEVRAGNKSAQALYCKLGFEGVGLRPGYYEDNREDALIMWLRDLPGCLDACQTVPGGI